MHSHPPGACDLRRIKHAYALLSDADATGAEDILADVARRHGAQADLWLMRYAATLDVAHLHAAWQHRATLGRLRQVIAPDQPFGALAPLYGDVRVWVDDEDSLTLAVCSIRAACGSVAQAWATVDRLPSGPDRDLLLATLCTRMGDHERAYGLAATLIDDEERGASARRLAALAALRDEEPGRAADILARHASDPESLWALVLALEPDEPALAQHAARAAWDGYAMPQAADYLASRDDLTDEWTQARWDAEYAPAP